MEILDVLENLLRDNPSVLANFRLTSLAESLLHVATKSGQLSFAHELMKIDPGIAADLNKDGFRALDIAVIMDNLEMVKEILSFDQGLCMVKGRDQRTALHYAAIKGRTEIIDELLQSCPDSIQEVTVHGETALHLAVKSYQFDAFCVLVKWLERLSNELIVNTGDRAGNTLLHLAVSTKQYATEVRVCWCSHSSKFYIHKTETSKNFKRTIKRKHDLQPQPSKNWFEYFKFQMQRDSPSDTRNALLVVAALIATVCFEAGINPPSGILEKPPQPNPPNQTFQPPPSYMPPAGGSVLVALAAILGSRAETFLFLFANSLALTASACIIIYLTSGFPFQRELLIALHSMMFTYGFGVSIVVKEIDKEKKALAYVLVTVAFILPYVQRWLPRWGKKAWKKWKKRDVRKTSLPIDHN
ncbi:hypothetical protein Sango_0163700 [Sesamum angolense]|uniref:PGG domain-containing protein n=1 Tax=Sesamum angolense TaxID=2727404 RepID=A0AAE1XGA9_9LAMI|nr:hypothetical protein Sango_0163700 [Sesamum angolense]